MKSCKTLTVGLVCWSLVLLAGCGSDTFEQIGAVGAPVTRDGPLAIDDVTPRHGVVDSDTVVMIRGKGFGEGTWVYFGDTPAEEVLVLNDGILTALTPSHGTGKVDIRVQAHIEGQTHEVALQDGFDFVVIPVSAGEVDTDGDGLTDAEELAGWDIKVDIFGFGLDPGQFGQFLEFHVASDPNDPDSDDDGLSDRDEFFVKANPTDEDTDGDGLWDGEEWFRWLTSPISVDTDGDARDNDPSSERSPLPPNAGLFDGAELYSFEELVKDPVDRGDIRFNATSPTLDDTDGDNVRDFDEVDTPVRTPLLADMPQLLFEIVDEVDIRLDVEYAEEEGKSTAFESSFSTSQSQTNSTSNTVSASVTVGAEVEIGLRSRAGTN